MKIHIILLSLLVAISGWAEGWKNIFEKEDGPSVVLADYDSSKRLVRISIKKGHAGDIVFRETFSVVNNQTTDKSLSEIKQQAGELLSESTFEDLSVEFETLKNINPQACEVLHISLENIGEDTNLDNLLEQIQEINNNLVVSSSDFKSEKMLEIDTPSGIFSLRFVVDEQGKIQKISAVKEGGDLKGFKLVQKSGMISLIDSNQNSIFSFRPSGFNENDTITLFVPNDSGLESHVRTHFKLTKNENKWKLTKISSNFEIDLRQRDSVPLTTTSVEHEPVIELKNYDIYIQTLTKNEITEKLNEANFEFDVTEFKRELDLCVAEKFLLREYTESNKTEAELVESCFIYVKANSILKSIPDAGTKGVFSSCISENELLIAESSVASWNFDKGNDDSNTTINKCHNTALTKSFSLKLRSEVQNHKFFEENSQYESLKNDFLSQVELKYNDCISSKGSSEYENCYDSAKNTLDIIILKADLANWISDYFTDNGEAYNNALNTILSMVDECASKELVEEACIQGVFLKAFDFIPQKNIRDQLLQLDFVKEEPSLLDNIEESIAEKINQCTKSKVQEGSISNLKDVEVVNMYCSFDVLKSIVTDLYGKHIKPEVFEFIRDEEFLESALSKIKIHLNDSLLLSQSPEEINEIIKSFEPEKYAIMGDSFVDIYLDDFFGESNSYNEQSKDAIKEKLSIFVGGNSSENLSLSLSKYFQDFYQKNSTRGVNVALKDFLKNVVKVSSEYELVRDLGQNLQDQEALESVVGEVQVEMNNCLDNYEANSDKDIYAGILKCKKEMEGEKLFLLTKGNVERYVSQHFELASIEGNRILSPVEYLRKCVRDIDPMNVLTIEDYKKKANVCATLTQADIQFNVYAEMIKSNSPVFKTGNIADVLRKLTCFDEQFFSMTNDFDSDELKSLFEPNYQSPETLSVSRSMNKMYKRTRYLGGASLLSLMFPQDNFDRGFSEADRHNLKNFINALAEQDNFNFDYLDNKFEKCRNEIDGRITEEIKEYIISHVPAAFQGIKTEQGESVEEILRNVIDSDMINLLRELKIEHDYDYDADISRLPAQKEIVSHKLAMQSVASFVRELSSMMSNGFVFDPDRMKTELVIFKGELKNALRFINQQDEPVKLEELTEFFGESELSDHLILSGVSKNVYDQISDYLDIQMNRELVAFDNVIKSRNNSSWNRFWGLRSSGTITEDEMKQRNAIRKKYENLKDVTKKMTSSYDFRRIINDDSYEGRELVEFLKEHYLLPKMMGKPISPGKQNIINRKIADRVLADDTFGGFVESFVGEVAQHQLSLIKDDKYFFQLWFHDSDDFDWEAIRKTKSGQEAISYYSSNILLPTMLNVNLTPYQLRVRSNKFKKLLNEAIGEN